MNRCIRSDVLKSSKFSECNRKLSDANILIEWQFLYDTLDKNLYDVSMRCVRKMMELGYNTIHLKEHFDPVDSDDALIDIIVLMKCDENKDMNDNYKSIDTLQDTMNKTISDFCVEQKLSHEQYIGLINDIYITIDFTR